MENEMSTGYYKAISPDGYIHLRSTASRTYTHAVAWGSRAQWCGRLDLAHKARNQRGGRDATILDAIEISAQEYRRLYAAKQPERDENKAAMEASRAKWRAELAQHTLVARAASKEPADRTPEEQAAVLQAIKDTQ